MAASRDGFANVEALFRLPPPLPAAAGNRGRCGRIRTLFTRLQQGPYPAQATDS